MITIYKPNSEVLKTIPDNVFFAHITAGELLEDHPEYDILTSDWNFTAHEGMIRFCTGNLDINVWVPMAPDVDVSWWLKKAWYLFYCETHGYTYAYTQQL